MKRGIDGAALADRLENSRLRARESTGMEQPMSPIRFAIAAAAVCLGACATSPAAQPGAPGAPVSSGSRSPAAAASVSPSRALQALTGPGSPDSATRAQIVALLGPPDVERHDGLGALLTWRLDTCALVLGFSADRLSSVSPGSRRLGGAAPALETCVAEAQARTPTS